MPQPRIETKQNTQAAATWRNNGSFYVGCAAVDAASPPPHPPTQPPLATLPRCRCWVRLAVQQEQLLFFGVGLVRTSEPVFFSRPVEFFS